jgi:4-amino-4-deoxy-L-arabinose transferase-like glycosyltransferase
VSHAERTNGNKLTVAIVLAIAAAIRLYLDNVVQFMTEADEGTYLDYTKRLFDGGIGQYPDLVLTYIGDRDMWLMPSPLRWSWLGATSFASTISGECTFRVLATVSMVAGIAAVWLTWRIGRELFDDHVALAAAALTATSPLQLALGRRALADEFFCALVLASIASLLAYLRTNRNAWLIAWIIFATLTFAAKEQFLLVYPVILCFWWLRTRALGWKTLIAWTLPCFLYFAVFCLLAHDVTSFFRIAHLTTSTIGAEYPEQYQNGPPHRLLIDLLTVSPLVTLAAIAAFGRLRNATMNERHLLALVAGIFIVHGLLSSKNLRYIVPADSLVRIVAATFVCSELRDRRWIAALIAINAAIELAIFRAVFLTGGVYDPVTSELMRTLKMLPH